MATIKQGQILVDKHQTHWNVLVASGDTLHLYNPVREAYKSINVRVLEEYTLWHPPTGEQRVKS